MSGETEISNAGDSASTESTVATTYSVDVKCPRPAYRRAGLAFVRGKNTVGNVSPEQLALLHADRVLTVVSETPDSPQGLQGGLDVLDVDGLNARIRAAVATLVPESTTHFTAGGEPRVKAVCEALGETVSAAQIKAALAESGDDEA